MSSISTPLPERDDWRFPIYASRYAHINKQRIFLPHRLKKDNGYVQLWIPCVLFHFNMLERHYLPINWLLLEEMYEFD